MKASLAELFSGHPTNPKDPRNQRNNTMNGAGLAPQMVEYRTPYNDGTVSYPIRGIELVDAVATPPRNPRALRPQDESSLGDRLDLTSSIPLGESQRSRGNPQAMNQAMSPKGMNTSASGARAQFGRG